MKEENQFSGDASMFDPVESPQPWVDERPEVEPDFYSFVKIDPDVPMQECFKMMTDTQRKSGATFFRATIINEEHEQPPYPHGLYLEGWEVAPHKLPTPSKQAPFNFPLTNA